MRNKATIKNLITICKSEVVKYNKIRSGILSGSINVTDKIPPDLKHWVKWCDKILKDNCKQIKTLEDKL